MKWKHNTKTKRKFIKPMHPNLGDTKIVIKFAFLPKIIKDRWIWLEKYHSIQEYKNTIGYYTEVVSWGGIKKLKKQQRDWTEVHREFKEWLNGY